MPSMKRPAASPAKAAPAKRPKAPSDPLADDKRLVVAALQKRKSGPESLPTSVIGMLVSMLPHAVGPAPTLEVPEVPQRHTFQKKILEDIGKELGQAEAHLVADVCTAQVAVDGADSDRDSLTAAARAAADNLQSKTDVATHAKEKLDAAAVAASEAAAAHTDAVAAEQAAAKALEVAEFKQEQLQKCFEKKALLEHPEQISAEAANEGGATTEAKKSPIKKSPAKLGLEATGLARSLKVVVDDVSLLDAMKLSLGKKPEDRGDFDQKVLVQLEEVMQKAMRELKQAAASNVAAKGSRAADLAAKETRKKALADAKDDAEIAHSTEEASLEEAKMQHRDATKALKSLDGEQLAAQERVVTFAAKVEDFRAGAMASYARLVQPPVPEAPAAPEAAPEADAALAVDAEEAA